MDDRRRDAFRRGLTPAPDSLQPIVDSLEKTGACVTTIDALNIASSGALLRAADELATNVRARSTEGASLDGKTYILAASDEEILSRPEVIAWGLEPAFLQVAERYIGAAVAYRGVVLRRDLADGQNVATRLWHIDGEDRRILKIIVYLTDVGEDGGPFEYVPKEKTPPEARVRLSGRISDEQMAEFAPRSSWVTCTGKRGTAVIVDTGTVYHRGRLPKDDRFTLFYAYNSQRPVRPSACQPLFARDRLLAAYPKLTSVQRSAIDYNY
jgi:hypothetical protein